MIGIIEEIPSIYQAEFEDSLSEALFFVRLNLPLATCPFSEEREISLEKSLPPLRKNSCQYFAMWFHHPSSTLLERPWN